jgi:hypothetical protein
MPIDADTLVDAVQTAALIVTAGAQIYTMLLLRNEMRAAARVIGRVGRRLEKIEATIGVQSSSSDDEAV